MKLGILCVSLRELAQSFPEWHVKAILRFGVEQSEKRTEIVLENQNFDEITAILDADGRLVNREVLIQQRSILNN